MYELSQRFLFEAAHTLQRSIDKQNSARVHGHTYFAEITICGMPNPATGMVTDLGVLRERIEGVRLELDHHLLDDIGELGPPTLENLCNFIARRLRPTTPNLSAVRVWRDGAGDGCRLSITVGDH